MNTTKQNSSNFPSAVQTEIKTIS